MNIIISLGFLLLTILSASLWGKMLFLRWIESSWSRGERSLLRIGLGLGVLSYLIFFLSLIGFLYRPVIFIILLLPSGWFWASRRKISPERRESPGIISSVRSLSLIEWVSFIIILAVFLLNIIASLTPPYAGDAIGYHLPPARDYLLAHKFFRLPGNVLSNQPAAVGTLFTIGFAGGGEFFPNLLHCVFGFMATMGIYLFGRRYFSRTAVILGALIFYTIPSVARISSWAYIDLGLTFWVLLGIFAFLHWRLGEGATTGGSLIISALFFGLAMGSKYTGLVLFAVLAVMVLGECLINQERRSSLGRIAAWAGIALAVASPWYLKNLWLTGNPFYPVLYSIFGGRGWDVVRAANFQSIIMGGMRMGLLDYIILPWNLTVRGGYTYDAFDGIIGPAFLVFLPLMIFVRKKNYLRRFLGIYSALYFIIWAVISLKVRKLIPVLAPASLLAGAALANLLGNRYSKLLKVLVILILCLVIGVNLQTIIIDWMSVNPLSVISGRETRDQFLSRMIFNYRTIDFTNKNIPSGSGILFVYGGNAWYYSRHRTIVDSIFQDYTIKEILRQSDSSPALLEAFRRQGITHLLFNFLIAEKGLFPELSAEKNDLLRKFLQQSTHPIFQNGPNSVLEIEK